MITEVKITDNTSLPLAYSNNIAALSNGATFQFKNGINIIIGNNGLGKTNIVEAIYYLSITKSFRTNNQEVIITFIQNFQTSIHLGKY